MKKMKKMKKTTMAMKMKMKKGDDICKLAYENRKKQRTDREEDIYTTRNTSRVGKKNSMGMEEISH